ncbi:MAG: iron-containing redox enzyme family protein [Chloroflexota bacterium]
MSTKEQLDTILEKWDLLKHPFYQAWSAGTLPVEALKVYAREYGQFIRLLPKGWETLRDGETAEEEREHAEMWQDFSAALGAPVDVTPVHEARQLADTARELFSRPASTLGAMYAFEAQQPATAKSKLNGLKTHYTLPSEVEPYFKVHSANWHESQKLLRQINALPAGEQAQAVEACDRMARALWEALTGIHDVACLQQN